MTNARTRRQRANAVQTDRAKAKNQRSTGALSLVEQTIAPTPEQIARGYKAEFVMDDLGLKARAHRNPESDTVSRWLTRGAIDERQKSAIDIYRRAHHLVFSNPPSVTMNWSAASHIRGTMTTVDFIQNATEAKQDLKRFEKEIFQYLPLSYFELWENVVIYDENIGTVGSGIGVTVRNESQIAAKVVIRMICDLIVEKWRL